MDIQNKLTFISELIDNVRDEIIIKVGDMPEDWDGVELRWYIAEKFKEAMIEPSVYNTRPEYKKRYQDYRNFIITTGNF